MSKIIIAAAALTFATIGGGIAAGIHDSKQTETTYRVGHMFGGGMGVIENVRGKWGIYSKETVVGLYSYGKPRVIGFGCDDSDMPLIAMEEDELPRCDRVEGITYKNEARWAN